MSPSRSPRCAQAWRRSQGCAPRPRRDAGLAPAFHLSRPLPHGPRRKPPLPLRAAAGRSSVPWGQRDWSAQAEAGFRVEPGRRDSVSAWAPWKDPASEAPSTAAHAWQGRASRGRKRRPLGSRTRSHVWVLMAERGHSGWKGITQRGPGRNVAGRRVTNKQGKRYCIKQPPQ